MKTVQGNKFKKCEFENMKLHFDAVEMSMIVHNCIIKKCFILSVEIILNCENSQFINSTILGYISDSIFKNVKMIDTKIDGEFENNQCFNCTLDGKEFVLEDNW